MIRYSAFTMKICSVIICFVIFFAFSVTGKSMGPIGKVTVNTIYKCPDKKTSSDMTVDASVKSIDNKGTKVFIAEWASKIPIDNTVKYDIVVREWTDAGWKDFIHHAGDFCTDTMKYASKFAQKFAAAHQPTLPPTLCPIKPGNYKVNKFQASASDLNFPVVPYGKLLVKLELIKNKDTLNCYMGEATSLARI